MATSLHKSISSAVSLKLRAPSQTSSAIAVKNGIASHHPIDTIRSEIGNRQQPQASSSRKEKDDLVAVKRWLVERPVEEAWNHIARTQQDLVALRVKVGQVKL
ncbi:hypothetical protein LTR84_010557 [Exophiala bonariae]|uniref:Uncharacterized protein n=1 Tax=Exophiala bonariae TaxID=1690606 RepID=A0AAV9MWE3_9EURO|nr:hypothetical protein LTR84_010557 [Exophiala bonariae]